MKKLLILLSLLPVIVTGQTRINIGSDSPMRKLQIAQFAIESLYVDSVDADKLVEDGIRGMLERLDPHSSFTTAKETQELNEPLQGNFDGIGVQFNIIEDTLIVLQTVHGGPSEKVGIIAGDRIISVNDTAIAGVNMSRADIMKRLRGKKGTKVEVLVKRAGERKPLAFRITRDRIPVRSVDAAYMVEPGIGYIRLGNFGAATHREMLQAADSLMRLGMIDLIVDLQDNGGGYLSAAEDIANEFLEKGDLIVYTTGRSIPRHEFRADGKGCMRTGKIVVLVNEFTASAAEILSGAIQDQDRGVIVGRRTFGKGLVQRPVELPDGSMIRLTVAHYYTPTGRCIQKPYKPGDRKAYDLDFEQRLKHGELTCRDSIHFADSLKFETLRTRRTVYGGGGIMPDIFVPLDTLQYTRYHRSLVAKGIVVQEVIKYYDKNRRRLRKFKTMEDFKQNFAVPETLIEAIVEEGRKHKAEPADDEEKQKSMPYLKAQLSALIARDLYGESAYFEIINLENPIFAAGLEEIRRR
ncbi:MAG: S41 family peptidase [Bacteroidales bacterium]|nr:S41 family peptidase [Bacteroidales bacterium]MCM1146848.1 S41 family peptidase [Bacteroidales bacterium]MCM1205654.1 S41 family peptidase [Bacillota bacterium]MCM1510234.1 S41 family peptidase [Clostridium sp.]